MPRSKTTKASGRKKSASSNQSPTMRSEVRAYKRELILNTAIDVFYYKGYQSSSVDDIAEAMGVTKAVVYYNYTSKDALLDSIVDRSLALTHESIDRGIENGKTPAEQLLLLCFYYAAHITENQKKVGVYFREERNFSKRLRQRATSLEKSVDEKVSAVLEAGIIAGEFRKLDARLTAITIMGMISMAFHWYRSDGRVSREQVCRNFADLALQMVGYNGELGQDQSKFELPAIAS